MTNFMNKSQTFLFLCCSVMMLSISCSKPEEKIIDGIATWGEFCLCLPDTIFFKCNENNDIDTIITDKVCLLRTNYVYHAFHGDYIIDIISKNSETPLNLLELQQRILHNGVAYKLSIYVNNNSGRINSSVFIDSQKLNKINNNEIFFGDYSIEQDNVGDSKVYPIQSISIDKTDKSNSMPIRMLVIENHKYFPSDGDINSSE